MMARRWLFLMLPKLYSSQCVRAVRKALVAYSRANAMLLSSGARALFLPTVAPLCKALRSMFLEALEAHLEPSLKRARALALVYSVAVVRGDGNHELATRVAVHGRVPSGRRCLLRPDTVVHGWSGADGAPVKPVEPLEPEG